MRLPAPAAGGTGGSKRRDVLFKVTRLNLWTPVLPLVWPEDSQIIAFPAPPGLPGRPQPASQQQSVLSSPIPGSLVAVPGLRCPREASGNHSRV